MVIFYSLFFYFQKDNNPELTPVDSLPQECISCVRAEFKSDNKEIILAPKSGGLQILNVSDNQVFISQNIDTSNCKFCSKYFNATT